METTNNTLKTLTITIILMFIALVNLYSQVPISYYDFENATHTTGETTVDQTINTVSGSTVTRSRGISTSFPDGAAIVRGGSIAGKSLASPSWSTLTSNPGTAAADYYQFAVNTSGFEKITLEFDYYSVRTNSSNYAPRVIGILYSTNGGTNFTQLGIASVNQNVWGTLTADLSAISTLNNNSNVIFRIYGYSAKGTASASTLGIDNVVLLAKNTVGTISKKLLNEPAIYTSYTSGVTGYVYMRYDFFINANAEIELNGQLPIGDTLKVASNGTLDCSMDGFVLCFDNTYIYGKFILSDNSTIKITSGLGIARDSFYYGNIITAFKSFSPNANYIYFQNDSKQNNITADPKLTPASIQYDKSSESEISLKDINSDVVIPAVINLQKDNKAVPQNTGNGIPASVKNVTINNANGVKLTREITVTNALTLTNGDFYTDSCTVKFGTAAADPSESLTSKIVGIAFMDYRPVGTDTINFLSCFIHPGADNLGNVSIERRTGELGTVTVGTNSSIECHWDIDITGAQPVSGRDVTYSWLSCWDGTVNFSQVNTAQLYLSEDFINWIPVGADFDVSELNPVRSMTETVNHFSYYVASGMDAPMPVELVSFNGTLINSRDIKLTWVTANEQNNDGFIIERSAADVANADWKNLGFVKGAGTTTNLTYYNFTDSKASKGRYNYRLKQIDNNGHFEYFNLNGTIEVGEPRKFELSQNYPNPFNPVTKIDFQLPLESNVTIKVYDMTGKEIAVLINEKKPAGFYTVKFDAGNLASGIYFYKINAETFTMTKKMLLVK